VAIQARRRYSALAVKLGNGVAGREVPRTAVVGLLGAQYAGGFAPMVCAFRQGLTEAGAARPTRAGPCRVPRGDRL
jgi:hypothetical protein